MGILDKFSLRGRVSVITGGERGIGLAIATGFAQAGSDIVVAGIDIKSVPVAKAQIEAENVKFRFIYTDVTSEESVQAMVDQVVEEFGHIDVLVNNAGVNKLAKCEEMSLDTWNYVMNVNLTGQFITSKLVGRVMLKQEKGSIVNIASMSGIIVNNPQTQCHYNTSKAGVIMLTKCFASEWAKRGIRVNAIAPGYIRTALTEHRFKDPDNPVVRRWMSMVPMGRPGTPEEIVGLALYFASDASSYTTGTVLQVDGGYTIW